MLEKKNKNKRQPEDLRKKYPVDRILSKVATFSISEAAKEFKIAKSLVAKIIKRYGRDDLKKKVSSRHPKKIKEKKHEEQQQESLSNIKEYMQNLEAHYTTLQTPTLNLAGLSSKLQMLTDRVIGISVNGNAAIDEIKESLRTRNVDFEYIEKMELSLRQYAATDLTAIRLAMQGCREQAYIQEKYIRLEAVSRDLQDVKTLIRYIFKSYNLLDDDSYRKIKEYLTTLAPAVETYFINFEHSYHNYKAERLGQGNITGTEAGKEKASGTKEQSN